MCDVDSDLNEDNEQGNLPFFNKGNPTSRSPYGF